MKPDHVTNTLDDAGYHAQLSAHDDRPTKFEIDCPRCQGRGELYHGVHRTEDGIWDYQSANPCHICDGTGNLTPDVAAEYRAYLQEQNDE